MKVKTIAILVSLLLSIQVMAVSGLEEITAAIKSANVSTLASWFDRNVEITILDDDATYSKAQAEQVVKSFFEKHVPKTFKLIHQGSSGGSSKYGIGELTTSDGVFRTYVYLKEVGGKMIIQELRFEKE